ncbi:MAG TPA: hypothetical protein VGN57_18550 [Pirellulaceae bacterium]|jgi:hypothetical protein|nr:hypothetical protein [Pirellulaceae bacterium]
MAFRGAPLLLAALVAVVSGCGPSDGRVPIGGDVKFQGAPLANGTIQFAAVDGSSMTGGDIVDGQYSIPAERSVQPGTYVVRISSVKEGANPAEELPGDSRDARNLELIPANWNVSSEEQREIVADGDNRFSFEIP